MEQLDDWIPKALPAQRTLFPITLDNLAAQAHVSIEEIGEWHEAGLLSFPPNRAHKSEPWHVAEVRFIAGIMHSGLYKPMVLALLAGLAAPYRYDPDLTAYNFARSEWQQIPARSMDELRDRIREEVEEEQGDMEAQLSAYVDGLAADGDSDALQGLRDIVDDGLTRAKQAGG